jgi:hypothetical protein
MMVFTWVSVDVMDFFLLSVGVRERFRMRVLSLTRDSRDVSSRGVDEPGVSTHFKHISYNTFTKRTFVHSEQQDFYAILQILQILHTFTKRTFVHSEQQDFYAMKIQTEVIATDLEERQKTVTF